MTWLSRLAPVLTATAITGHVATHTLAGMDTQPPRNPPSRAVVVGGGVVGMCTAYHLARQGVQVTIVESNAHVGRGTTFGNAGSLRGHGCAPVISRESIPKLLNSLFFNDGTVVLHPSTFLNLDFVRWGVNFLYGAVRNDLSELSDTILALIQASNKSLNDILEREGIPLRDISMQQVGSLTVYRDAGSFRDKVNALCDGPKGEAFLQDPTRDTLSVSDYLVILKGHDAVVAREPAVASFSAASSSSSSSVVGAIHDSSDRSADSFKFTDRLSNVLVEKYGVQVLVGETVDSFDVADGTRVSAVNLVSGKSLPTDAVVVCAGYKSPDVARLLRDRLCIYPMRGYSVTYDCLDATKLPSQLVIDSSVFITPFDHRIRFVSVGEFAPRNYAPNTKCWDDLDAKARKALGEIPEVDLSSCSKWMGHRPQTPDDLPIICRGELDNVFFNTGHGSRGWVMGAASGELVASLVLGDTGFFDRVLGSNKGSFLDKRRFW